MRILATADWQLDMLGGRLSVGAREHLSRARVSTIERLLVLAEEEGVDVILAAGDLFEYPSPSAEVVTAVAEVLQRHRDIPIHAIPGNHDLHGPGTVWQTPELEAISHFHLHAELSAVELGEGVRLHAIPVKSKFDTQPQDEQLGDVSEVEGTHIVMAHGHDVAYIDLGHEDCKLPINSTRLVDKGYALIVLGHWHSWNQVSERVLYPGTHEQTKFGESDAGYVAIIDLPQGGGLPTIEKRKVGQICWAKESFDCTGKQLPDALADFVRERSEEVDFLELTLCGEVGLDDALDAVPRAERACRPMLEHLEWIDETTQLIDIDAMTETVALPLGLREIQRSILLEIQEAEGDEGKVQGLRDELHALYRACRDVGVTEAGPST